MKKSIPLLIFIVITAVIRSCSFTICFIHDVNAIFLPRWPFTDMLLQKHTPFRNTPFAEMTIMSGFIPHIFPFLFFFRSRSSLRAKTALFIRHAQRNSTRIFRRTNYQSESCDRFFTFFKMILQIKIRQKFAAQTAAKSMVHEWPEQT